MKLIAALTTAVVALACGKEATKQPCERGAKVELRVVDNDSPFMKKLYAHVGAEGREGNPRDPAAIAAGLRVEVDQWRTDPTTPSGLPTERKTETDYYLLGFDNKAIERYLAGYEQPPADREIRLEFIPPRPDVEYLESRAHWRTYYVEKEPMLDTRALAEVELGTNPINEDPMLLFVLTNEGKRAFHTGTTATVGKKVATLIDGAITSAPIIMEPITGGRFSVNLPTRPAAEALLAKLRCVK